MTCKEKLQLLTKEGKALLAANFYNFETLKGLLEAARQTGSSIILQLSESSLRYLGIAPAVSLARAMLTESGVEGWVHLDHGSSLSIVTQCIEAGFDSVMIDASERSFEENLYITRKVVAIAGRYGVNVEAELGYVAKLDQEQTLEPTAVEDAKHFVE